MGPYSSVTAPAFASEIRGYHVDVHSEAGRWANGKHSKPRPKANDVRVSPEIISRTRGLCPVFF